MDYSSGHMETWHTWDAGRAINCATPDQGYRVSIPGREDHMNNNIQVIIEYSWQVCQLARLKCQEIAHWKVSTFFRIDRATLYHFSGFMLFLHDHHIWRVHHHD